MIGFTDRERELAIAAQGPGTGMCLALAELELFWEHHRANAPDVHELRLNIRIAGSTEDKLAAVQAIADWLGVPVTQKNGCYIAMRRFGAGEDSVTVEAHYTPDPARAHFERLEARDSAQARPELAEVAAA